MTPGWIGDMADGNDPAGTTTASESVLPQSGASVLRGAGDGTRSIRLSWHGMSDRGRVRPQNEDSFACIVEETWALFVVADGMGGHDAGEVASRIAVEVVCREIVAGIRRGDRNPVELVETAVQQANREVSQEGERKSSNMGTTVSLVLVTTAGAVAANVGDSRIYWSADGLLTQVSQDHSLVASLVASGELTKEGARNHPRANILYRTVGRPETIAVDTFEFPVGPGGVLLLCSDGLWGEVDDDGIGRVLASAGSARPVGEELVEMANANGGKDNVTVVVARFD